LASFDEHINQAKRNLQFLESVNNNINPSWDWQVTVAFYSALHLINAHIASKTSNHYRSHESVNNVINPMRVSPAKLGVDEYASYIKLQNLSRRARYLCHEDPKKKDGLFLTYDKHFAKAIRNLDILLTFMVAEYKISFKKSAIKCIELNNFNSTHFDVVR
jgi:hypothetical protein